jgi:hypothetical protein
MARDDEIGASVKETSVRGPTTGGLITSARPASRLFRRYRLSFGVASLLSIGVAAAGVNLWTTNGPVGGSVSGLLVDPNDPSTLYVGTKHSGVFKSRDGGANWSSASVGLPFFVDALALSPSSTNVLYSMWQQTIYKSVDSGAHWSSAGSLSVGLFTTLSVAGLAVDPTNPNTVWAAANDVHSFGSGTVWKSTDGGSSWTAVRGSSPGTTVGIVAIDPRGSHVVFAEVQGLVRTSDGGATWSPTAGLTSRVVSLVFPGSSPSVVAAGTSEGGAFLSMDGGATWAPSNSGLAGDSLSILGLATIAASPGSLFAATKAGLYRSDDLAGTWRLVSSGPRYLLRSDPSSSTTLYAVDTGVSKSTDGGMTWVESSHGLIATDVRALAASSGGRLYAAVGENVFASTDAGSTWRKSVVLPPFGQVTAILVDPKTPSTVYAGTCSASAVMYRTLDGGTTWLPFNSGMTFEGLCVRSLAAQPGTQGAVFAGTLNQGLFRLAAGTDTWQLLGSGPASATALWIDPSHPDTVWAGGIAGLFRSDNGGATWGSALLDKRIRTIAGDPHDGSILYVVNDDTVFGSDDAVLKTMDAGGTWTSMGEGLPNSGISSIVFDSRTPTSLYAATGYGVYRTVNGGLGWAPFDNGLRLDSFLGLSISQLALDPGTTRLYAATLGDGVASWDLTNDRTLPAVASLHGVAPTYYHSDVAIFNTSPVRPASVKATYRCFLGSCDPAPRLLTVPPRHSLLLSDVATSLFGAPETGGPLDIESDVPISVTSRLYTPQLPEPTTGMLVPGLDPADAAPTQVLLLLSHSADGSTGARSNVGVFNPTDTDQEVTFRFFEAGGAGVGGFTRHVAARRAIQVNDDEVAAELRLSGDLPSFYALVEGDGVLPVLAYAAVIDNESNDLFFVRGRGVRMRFTTGVAFHNRVSLPAVASLHGRGNSFFLSDVAVFNTSQFPNPVVVRYHCFPACSASEQTLTLAPGEMRILPDIVNSVFGAPETGGAIDFDARVPIVVGSRLYTPEHPRPTVGMFVPGLGLADATTTAVLTSLSHSADATKGFRTNVGVYNVSDTTQTVTLELFDESGTSLGRTELSLVARQAFQVNDIFRSIGVSGDVANAYCNVRGDGANAFYAYAAVIDNQTQDPIFIPGANDLSPAASP